MRPLGLFSQIPGQNTFQSTKFINVSNSPVRYLYLSIISILALILHKQLTFFRALNLFDISNLNPLIGHTPSMTKLVVYNVQLTRCQSTSALYWSAYIDGAWNLPLNLPILFSQTSEHGIHKGQPENFSVFLHINVSHNVEHFQRKNRGYNVVNVIEWLLLHSERMKPSEKSFGCFDSQIKI